MAASDMPICPLNIAGNVEGLVVATQPGIAVSGRVVLAEGQSLETRALRITLRAPRGGRCAPWKRSRTIDDDRRFRGQDVFGPHLVRMAGLPPGSTVKAVMLRGEDITDVPTIFRAEDSRPTSDRDHFASVDAGGNGPRRGRRRRPAKRQSTCSARIAARGACRRPGRHKSDIGVERQASVSAGLAAGRYYAIAVAREGFRQVPATRGKPSSSC